MEASASAATVGCRSVLERLISGGGSPDPRAAAEGLIAEFGSIGAALCGSKRRQLRATANDEAAIVAVKQFHNTMMHVLRSAVYARPVLQNFQALLDYLKADMGHRTSECVRVLHLNTRNMLICDEIMFMGTVDEASLHVREILARACEVGSVGIFLVHNHPSGDPTPSQADIEATRRVAAAAKLMNVRLYDHLIVTRSEYASLKRLGHF